MMKNYIWHLIMLTQVLCATSCLGQNYVSGYVYPNAAMSSIGNGLQQMLNNNYYTSPQQSAMYGEAAVLNAQSNYVLNSSMANINNQASYSMQLNNQQLRTRIFFENRQINAYYRDMEEWQRQERRHMKRYGIYDKDSIQDIYNVRKP